MSSLLCRAVVDPDCCRTAQGQRAISYYKKVSLHSSDANELVLSQFFSNSPNSPETRTICADRPIPPTIPSLKSDADHHRSRQGPNYLNPSSRANSEASLPSTPNSSSQIHSQSSAEVSPITEEFSSNAQQSKPPNRVPVSPEQANRKPTEPDNPSPSHNFPVSSSQEIPKMSAPATPASNTWQDLAPKSGGFFRNYLSKKKPTIGKPPSTATSDPWTGSTGQSIVTADSPQDKNTMQRIRAKQSNDRLRAGVNMAPAPVVPSVVTTITSGKDSGILPKRHPFGRTTSQPIKPASVTSPIPPRIELPKFGPVDDDMSELRIDDRPMSRFSATTHGSSDPDNLSVSVHGSAAASTDSLSPAMVRDRLIPKARALASSSKATARKPTPMQLSQQRETPDSAPEHSPEIQPQHSPEIQPQGPLENQTQKRIKELQTRRDSLWSRRNNIQDMIHELTQVVQPSSISYDLAVRDEVKKTVASLNDELAELQREEHEVGMKLVRAWRRRDERELNGGGSSLWVRRVTT